MVKTSFVVKLLLAVLSIGILAIAGYLAWQYYNQSRIEVTDFDSCVAANGIIMETYPAQCRDKNGKAYTEQIITNFTSTKNKTIKINNFFEGYILTNSLKITGKAPSSWFFEGSFPVEVTNANGDIIAQGIAVTIEDWMTDNDVNFIVDVEFEKQTAGETGWVIIKKDNPSGLPENDDQIKIQISFGE